MSFGLHHSQRRGSARIQRYVQRGRSGRGNHRAALGDSVSMQVARGSMAKEEGRGSALSGLQPCKEAVELFFLIFRYSLRRKYETKILKGQEKYL
jgi:hypothetical protein